MQGALEGFLLPAEDIFCAFCFRGMGVGGKSLILRSVFLQNGRIRFRGMGVMAGSLILRKVAQAKPMQKQNHIKNLLKGLCVDE